MHVLQGLALFSELNTEEKTAIAEIMQQTKVVEGEVLATRGQTAHTFFVILSGSFMVHFNKGRAFTLHKKGDIMGWSAVVTPFKYTGTMTALTDGEVLYASGESFMRLIQSNADLGDRLMKKINAVVAERKPFWTPSR
jgi:CRP-like cAMP-binding protein